MAISPSPKVRTWLSLPETIGVGVALLLALAAAPMLTQSDGDLFAHIAFGREVIRTGEVPRQSLLGLASNETPFVAPAWGAATIFAAADAVGGLALISVLVALLAGLTHTTLAFYMKRQGANGLTIVVGSMIGFVLASSHWLARPHAFSLVASAILLVLLERGSKRSLAGIPLLFAVWANLHGAWAFGLIVLIAYTAGECIDTILHRLPNVTSQLGRLVAVCILSILATLVNPFGAGLHVAVLRTLTDSSVSGVINEYQPPSFGNPIDIFFFVTIVVSIIALIANRAKLRASHAILLLLCTLFAFRAGRNISLFGVIAWPLLVAHFAPFAARVSTDLSLSKSLSEFSEQRSSCWGVSLVAVVLLAIGLNKGRVGSLTVVDGEVSKTRFPVEATLSTREGGLDGNMLTTWAWSGYVPYAWMGKRTYFDPLYFSAATLRSFGSMLLAKRDWRQELDRASIVVALLPSRLPLADSLRGDGAWNVWHSDSTALVFVRRASQNSP